VVELEADLGVAFDADGDRAFFVDDKGVMLPAYLVAALLYSQSPAPYVADELVYQALSHINLISPEKLHPSRVGSYFVKEEMRRVGATVGAEFSGHYYFKDFFGADSGIFTMIKILELVSGLEQKLSEYCQTLPAHLLANDDVRIEGKTWSELEKQLEEKYQGSTVTVSRRDGLTLDFGKSWISIRSSNTEPLLRLVAGGDSANSPTLLLEEIKHVLQ
jgi:phosphomannomutase